MNDSSYFSGSGDFGGSYFSGSGDLNGSSSPFFPNFPCRATPYSKDSVTPFVWGKIPQLEGARWYLFVIETIFFLLGLTWNSFILACYIKKPKLLKEPANIYLANLAIIDILISVFITFTCLASEGAGEFVFGSSDFTRCIYCQFLGAVAHLLVSMSLHTLTALSVDRCILLSRPLHYKSICNWKRAVVVQVILWIISIIISLPPAFGFGEFEYNLVFAFCNARWTGISRSGIPNIYYVLFYSLETIIPIVILAFTNIWIIKIVKSVLKKGIVRKRSIRKDSDSGTPEEKKYINQQKQLVRVFGALFVGHVICWLPVLTVLFTSLGIGAEKIPLQIFLIGWLCYLINPVVHPVVETFFVKDLRYTVNKTKKKVRSSLKKATLATQSTLIKRVGSRSFSSQSLGNSTSSTNTEKSVKKSNLENVSEDDALVLKNRAFGHSTEKSEMLTMKKYVSFQLDDDVDISKENVHHQQGDGTESEEHKSALEEGIEEAGTFEQNSPLSDHYDIQRDTANEVYSNVLEVGIEEEAGTFEQKSPFHIQGDSTTSQVYVYSNIFPSSLEEGIEETGIFEQEFSMSDRGIPEDGMSAGIADE